MTKKKLVRMNANSLSAWEEMQKDLPEIHLQIINTFRDNPVVQYDSYEMARMIGKSNGDTKPRLTELYNANWIKITGTIKNNRGIPRALYQLKSPFDTPNPIHRTPNKKLKDLIQFINSVDETDLFSVQNIKEYCETLND